MGGGKIVGCAGLVVAALLGGAGCLGGGGSDDGCPSEDDTDTDTDTGTDCPDGDAPRATVDAYYAAFNRHDSKAVGAFYAEDAVLEDPQYATPLQGRTAIVGHVQALFDSLPDVRDEVRNVVSQPDQVAVEFVATGTPAGGGAPFSLPLANIFQFENGLIVRDATYYDR